MAKLNTTSNENVSQESKDFIKKISIKNFVVKSKIEKLQIEDKKLLAEILNELKNNDKEVLSYFDVKLSEKEKEKALEYYNLLK